MNSYRRGLDALGAFWSWMHEVADLTLVITQILFGALLVWALGYTIWTGHFYVLAHGIELFALVSCLRILFAPAPLSGR